MLPTSGRGVLAEHHGPVSRARRRPVGLVVAEVRHGAVLHAPPAHVDPVDAGRVPRLEDLPQHAWRKYSIIISQHMKGLNPPLTLVCTSD